MWNDLQSYFREFIPSVLNFDLKIMKLYSLVIFVLLNALIYFKLIVFKFELRISNVTLLFYTENIGFPVNCFFILFFFTVIELLIDLYSIGFDRHISESRISLHLNRGRLSICGREIVFFFLILFLNHYYTLWRIFCSER